MQPDMGLEDHQDKINGLYRIASCFHPQKIHLQDILQRRTFNKLKHLAEPTQDSRTPMPAGPLQTKATWPERNLLSEAAPPYKASTIQTIPQHKMHQNFANSVIVLIIVYAWLTPILLEPYHRRILWNHWGIRTLLRHICTDKYSTLYQWKDILESG